MYSSLIWIAAAVGLLMTLGAMTAVFYIFWPARKSSGSPHETEQVRLFRLRKLFMRWSWFDYVVIIVFLSGAVFLIADLAAVIRDSEQYPFYHYGYLATGVVFTLLSTLLLFLRLGTLIALGKEKETSSDAPLDQNSKPAETDQAEQGV